jgi:voltage-gated potassium channel
MPLLQAHNLPPHVEVVGKGTPGDAMYFIASGKLETHTGKEQRTYSAGDVFGVGAMLGDGVHDVAIVTASKCRLLKLHRDDFHRLASKQPHIASHIRSLATDFRNQT